VGFHPPIGLAHPPANFTQAPKTRRRHPLNCAKCRPAGQSFIVAFKAPHATDGGAMIEITRDTGKPSYIVITVNR